MLVYRIHASSSATGALKALVTVTVMCAQLWPIEPGSGTAIIVKMMMTSRVAS